MNLNYSISLFTSFFRVLSDNKLKQKYAVYMGGISAPKECLRDRRNRDVLGPKLEMELKFPHPRGTKMHLECY